MEYTMNKMRNIAANYQNTFNIWLFINTFNFNRTLLPI